MAIYRIAGLNIKMEPEYDDTKKRLSDYLTVSDSYDFEVSYEPEEFEKYVKSSPTPNRPDWCEGTLLYTKICFEVLEKYNGIFFHSSCLELDGEGYIFTALSGTGKSTHTRNWRRLFGDKVIMINDDKPIVRKIDGRFYVCGTPWMGKSEIGCNRIAPVKAIYVLQRGEENHAERISPGAVFKQLLEATLLPRNKESMQKLLTVFNELFSQVPLFLLTCNKDIEAAQVAYDAAQI